MHVHISNMGKQGCVWCACGASAKKKWQWDQSWSWYVVIVLNQLSIAWLEPFRLTSMRQWLVYMHQDSGRIDDEWLSLCYSRGSRSCQRHSRSPWNHRSRWCRRWSSRWRRGRWDRCRRDRCRRGCWWGRGRRAVQPWTSLSWDGRETRESPGNWSSEAGASSAWMMESASWGVGWGCMCWASAVDVCARLRCAGSTNVGHQACPRDFQACNLCMVGTDSGLVHELINDAPEDTPLLCVHVLCSRLDTVARQVFMQSPEKAHACETHTHTHTGWLFHPRCFCCWRMHMLKVEKKYPFFR